MLKHPGEQPHGFRPLGGWQRVEKLVLDSGQQPVEPP